MPKIVDARTQRGEIRRAARRVFSQHGVAGTGLARVAAAAGMGRSSLYHYYPDKASLVRDLIRNLLSEEEAVFREALRGEGDALERIERLMITLAGMFEAWARAGRMIADLRVRDARLFRPFFRRVRRELAGAIREGREDGVIDERVDPELASTPSSRRRP
jgi:AcrR family transcriptional regulator